MLFNDRWHVLPCKSFLERASVLSDDFFRTKTVVAPSMFYCIIRVPSCTWVASALFAHLLVREWVYYINCRRCLCFLVYVQNNRSIFFHSIHKTDRLREQNVGKPKQLFISQFTQNRQFWMKRMLVDQNSFLFHSFPRTGLCMKRVCFRTKHLCRHTLLVDFWKNRCLFLRSGFVRRVFNKFNVSLCHLIQTAFKLCWRKTVKWP